MKPFGAVYAGVLGLGLCMAMPAVQAQSALRSPCAASSAASVRIHAPSTGTRTLSLCDGYTLSGASSFASARPLSLTQGDFDEDGVDDLISGYSSGNGGTLTMHRGNIAALWPYGAALRNGPPAPFLSNARQFSLPEPPDFVVAGDFDADGHLDLVAARRGGNALYFLKGDGHGNFHAAEGVPLDGAITALITGEINHADGLADLVVAVNGVDGPRALVYESPIGALKGQPEVFKLPNAASSLVLGHFDGGTMNDLAVGAGDEIVMIHARDRRLSSSETVRAAVQPARISVQKLEFSVQALTAGDFTGVGPSVAALGSDGQIHILEHATSEKSLLANLAANAQLQPSMQVARAGTDGKLATVSGAMPPSMAARLEAVRQSARLSADAPEWTEKDTIAMPGGFSQRSPRLVAARVTGSTEEDIVAADTGNNQLHVFSTISSTHRPSAMIAGRAATPAHMALLSSLVAESAPTAVLPMRLGVSGLSGLVALQDGQSGPVLMPEDIPPANVFTVTNTSDGVTLVGTQYTGPAGSLRAAMYNASQVAGTSSIVFNIPTTDPGFNAATGTFLIQPLSESVPGSLNNFALPPVNNTVIIDGYTQPGASPNTLAIGDNAKLLIQIDGSKATTPGGSGLSPFDDVGSVYRGMVFTGWTTPAISGGTASGAEGIEAGGVQDYIEGNFFGTDPTGKVAAPNRIGVFADAGPGFGSTAGGNIIGGTTPQARNILSGNSNSGILFLSTAYEAQLQGNYIGLDITGAAILSNPSSPGRSNLFDGVGLNGPTVTIGGTQPGTANVIAGNGTNVDINDLTNGNAASDSIVQGNLIGTNAAGTAGFSGQGYGVSILHNPTDMLIGGTTPAARNVISGNLAGVYIFDNSFDNLVEGNYIGVDETGTKALANQQQGFITGATTSSAIPAGDTTIGGSVPGAGNVISGNTLDGIQISGTSLGPTGQDTTDVGNFILGNFIGTDATGTASIPNGGNGVDLTSSATNNVIGGTAPGSGNLIAHNTQNGVLIDPGTASGTGTGNNTVANVIQSNGGSGVRINTGSRNRISQNSIYSNGDLGINLQNAGANLNTPCNSSNTGANNLQNAPSLTVGSGALYITATATDPNGNTSEFSNAVKSTGSGNILDLLGSFNSTASTTYTIEFFSSPTADPSGYGEGQTYLTAATVTTDASCNSTISNPVDTTQADVAVTLASNTPYLSIGPDFGGYQITGTVTNNGPATATNVVFTDTLPTGLEISGAYCDLGPCQSPATSSLGNCTVSGNKITCDMGTMAPGATAQVTIPVQTTGAGSLSDTATAEATQTDPAPANNTAGLGVSAGYPFPFIDHIDPASALTQTTGNLPITVYGIGFVPTSAVTVNGTAVPTTGYFDNEVCGGPFEPSFCSAIEVSIPASLLGSAGTAVVTVTNPDPTPYGSSNEPTSANLTLVSSCTYTAQDFGFNPVEAEGDTLIAEEITVTTNAPTCTWTAAPDASAPWLAILDNATGTGNGTIDVAVAPNTGAARSGKITVAGNAVEFDQSAGDSTVCSYSLNPASTTIPAAGITSSFAVTTGSSCSYFVEPYPQDSTYVKGVQFITIPESSGLLVGNGNPSYTVAANHGAPRNGSIMVGGEVFSFTQSAPACYYTLSTSSANIPVNGGNGTIAVTPSSPTCAWTAKSSDTSLLTVTSGASGTGNGSVSYSVPANAEGPQTATITIGDSNGGYSIFTENQTSAFTCTFTISPGSIEVPSDGLSNFFQVTASFNFCKWTAVSSDPSSLTVNDVSGESGLSTNGSAVGTGVVYYRVGQNTTGAPRTITITAGCEIFTVNQDAPAASNPVPAITTLQPTGATAGTAAFTLTVNGSGFISGSVVSFNGNAKTTTYVSASQLTAAITAADIANAGAAPVTVTNPSPGGGISNSVSFTIAAPAGPGAQLSPTSIPFPDTATGSTSAAQTVTLTNNGGAALTISGISITGANPTDFAEINTCGGSLASGSTCSISVTFTPASVATFNAMLSVADNATGSPQTVTLSGNGITPPAPAVSLTPPSLTFTAQTGTTSTAQTVTLKNTGNGALTVSGISIIGTNPTDFAQTNTCGSSLAGGSTCFISVTFTPASSTTFGATLSVADTATGSPHTVTLSGTGTAAPAPGVSFAPTSLTFSAQTGTTSAAQTVTLTNTGTAALTISGISIAGTNPIDFAETNTCGSSVAASSSCTISVTFSPASATSFSAMLSVADNATGSPQTVTLSGTGTAAPAPGVSLTPSSLTFSVQTGATSTAQTATLTNTGTAALTIGGISITGTNPGDFAETNTCGGSVAASSSCSISITFTPASAASFSATLSVADNASGSPHTVTLSGAGTAPLTPTFALSSTTAPQTINAGGSATYTITVAAQNGALANPVTLAASGLPAGATATFNPASVSPGNSSATSQLTIQTSASAASAGFRSPWLALLLMLPLWSLFRYRRRWTTLVALLLVSLGAATVLAGCGGGFGLKTGSTYNITVTGTSGAIQQTTTVQLKVQ